MWLGTCFSLRVQVPKLELKIGSVSVGARTCS